MTIEHCVSFGVNSHGKPFLVGFARVLLRAQKVSQAIGIGNYSHAPHLKQLRESIFVQLCLNAKFACLCCTKLDMTGPAERTNNSFLIIRT